MVKNPSQIRYVFTKLEKGITGKFHINQMLNPTGLSYGIMIRTSNGTVLENATLYPNDRVIQIDTQHGSYAGSEFISLNPALLQYLDKKLRKSN
ncbi:hypothetical protein [Alicyclobacillus sp. SO9]|uniref:hypothetical protein n=1 Tax=Alicyclobacillus sp. SO9 TaxID=2665646 RepID=UPI001E43F528|nr:hypothetical protein [Alicyclobacillus sp. SO9]